MFTQRMQSVGRVLREWRQRSRSRRELAMFGPIERLELGCRFDLEAEMHKPFWQS